MSFSGKPYGINPSTGLIEPLTNISGLSNIYFVRVATTANLTATYSSEGKTLTNSGANAALSIDGVSLSAEDKVLVKNQSTGSQNGLYIVTTVGDGSTPWVLTRSPDMDTSTETEERDWFWVTEGSTNADNGFALSTPGSITLDTTTLTFTRMLGSATGSGQAASAALTDISDLGVVSAADKFIYSVAEGVWTFGTLTAAGRALLDDADAAAQRTTLGLGTAATLNVGTGANNIPQLNDTGKLPAVDGSLLTGISAGSPYASDEWTEVWEAADGSTGWSTSGSATTNAISTFDSVSAWTVTTSSSSAFAYRTLAASAPSNSFEIRAKVQLTVAHASNDPGSWIMFTAFGKLFRLCFGTNGLGLYGSTGGIAGYPMTAQIISEWTTITLRVYSPDTDNTAPTTSKVTCELWLGEVYAGTAVCSALVASSGSNEGAAGAFSLGTTTATGTAAVAWVAYRNGLNEAPPCYTFRGLGYAPDTNAP